MYENNFLYVANKRSDSMIQVLDGEIKQYSLPKTGTLKDGSTVSGYHLLDEEILKSEGWLPLEDNLPTYNIETQHLVDEVYEILIDKVIKKYIVEDIPAPQPLEPTELELLQNKVAEQDAVIEELMFIIIPELMGGM